MEQKYNINKAFTLIELLVVMAIIGILIAMSTFGLQNARKGARDARRQSDLETIRQAFEAYKSDCNFYPSALPAVGSSITNALAPCSSSGNTYLRSVPGDPIATNSYIYQPSSCSGSNCSQYKLWARLENPPTAASYCTSPPSCGGATCNYCVINP